MKALNILLVGEEAAGLQTLRMLQETDHKIAAVMSTNHASAEKGVTLAGLADELGCEVLDARLVKDPLLANRIREEAIDLLLNVHSLYVIHEDVLRAPRVGCFNLHPGPLPEYAGLDVVSWAIFNGEERHAVTLHWMDAGIDTGPVAYTHSFDIDGNDIAISVYSKCLRHGLPLIKALVETAVRDAGAIPKTPQDLARRRYYRRQIPHDGRLDWSKTAYEVANFVRACDYHPFRSPWGYPATALGDGEIRIVRAARTGLHCAEPPGTVTQRDGGPAVATADEWVRVRLVLVDDRVLPAAEVLNNGHVLQ